MRALHAGRLGWLPDMRTLHDGDGGGRVVVDRVHVWGGGGEEAEVAAARAEGVMAVAAVAARAAEGRAGRHVEQDVVQVGGALDPGRPR